MPGSFSSPAPAFPYPRRHWHRQFAPPLAAAALAAGCATVAAQQPPGSPPPPAPRIAAATLPSAQANISPRVVGVAQRTNLAILVSAAQEITSTPDEIRVDGLDIGPPSVTTFQTVSRGATVFQTQLVFPVIPLRAGTFTIPPQQFVADGASRTTPAVRFVAREGAQVASEFDPYVELKVASDELYPGQVAGVEISIYVHQTTNLLNLPLPEISHPNFVIKRPERPDRQRELVGPQPYIVYTYHTSFQAIQPGEFSVGPVLAEANVSFPDPPGGDGRFFQRLVSRKFNLTSNAVDVTIRPLPTAGRPASFSGAVGSFRLGVNATPTTLNVGDPVALDISVSGQGNFDAVAPPAFPALDGWRLYPPITVHENRTLGLQPGVVRFNQIAIPTALTDVVPPLEFSYFDPGAGEFVTLLSDPIPLDLSPDPGARLPVESASFAEQSTGVPVPDEDLADILEVPVAVPLAWFQPQPPLHRRPMFWVAQALPAALVALLLGAAVRRQRANARPAAAALEPARDAHTVLDAIHRAPLGGNADDTRRFYRLVSEFCSLVPPTGGTAPPELAGLAAAADQAAFGGGGHATLCAAERERILATLARFVPPLEPGAPRT